MLTGPAWYVGSAFRADSWLGRKSGESRIPRASLTGKKRDTVEAPPFVPWMSREAAAPIGGSDSAQQQQ
jgi:hypothetical protein